MNSASPNKTDNKSNNYTKLILPPINTCVPMLPKLSTPLPIPPSPSLNLLHTLQQRDNHRNTSPLKNHNNKTNNTNNTTDNILANTQQLFEFRSVSPTSLGVQDEHLSQKCKLSKCIVCEKGVPESFSHAKPISWYASVYLFICSCSCLRIPRSKEFQR